MVKYSLSTRSTIFIACNLPSNWKAIQHSIMATAWSSCKALWALHIEPDKDQLTDNDNPELWK